MKLDHLEKLFIEQLNDAYSAEKQLVVALPKMERKASTPELKEAINNHLEETQGQVERIEKIFETIEGKPGRHKCKAMEGLIEEAQELLKEDAEPIVRDAAIICAAQKVEHYEIATYGCLRAYAKLLGHDEAVQLIDETLDQEKNADKKLTQLAEQWVNTHAAQPDVQTRTSSKPAAAGRH